MKHLVTKWMKAPRYLVELGLWVEQIHLALAIAVTGAMPRAGHKPPGILTTLIAAKRLFSHH